MPRFRQLDSLRGIAAVTVVLHHFIWARLDTQTKIPPMPTTFWLSFHIFHILFLGQEAVLLFFVLSGVVLAWAISARRPLLYGDYVIHRVCRIYLPYLFSLMLSSGACALYFRQIPPWTPWLANIWTRTPLLSEFFDHLLFLGTYPHKFNPVYWSLIVEMRVSLLLPLVVLFFQRLRMQLALRLLAAITVTDSILQPFIQRNAPVVVADWILTIHYLIIFCYGIMIALHSVRISAIFLKLSQSSKNSLLIGSIFTAFYAWPLLSQQVPNINWDFLAGLGAVMLISLAMFDQVVERFLSWPLFMWLGKISYSLYLIHMTVLLLCIAMFEKYLRYRFIFVVAFLGSLLASECMVRAIEKPAQRLGRSLDRAHRNP